MRNFTTIARSRGRRSGSVIAVVTAAAVVLAGAVPASAQDRTGGPVPGDWLSEVTDSRMLDAPPIASGVVYREDARSPVPGAAVTLYAHPKLEDRTASLDGEALDLEMTPLAKTVTGGDGGYVLRLDPHADLDEVRSEQEGTVDARLIVRTPEGVSFHAFSILPDGTVDDEDVDFASDEEIAVVEDEGDAVIKSVQVDLQMTSTSAPAQAGIRTSSQDSAPMGKGCSSVGF